MKIPHIFLLTVSMSLLLQACTTNTHSNPQLATNFLTQQTIVATTDEHYPVKNPQTVAVYTHGQKPAVPYKVIGVAKVAKHNFLGTKREEHVLHSMMKSLAASIGGDAVIDVSANEKHIQANVIAFQKILI